MKPDFSTDVLVIGGGIAGLSTALRLAEANVNVLVLSKLTLTEGSSWYAQGGIAAVLSNEDTFEAHIADTLTAGAGLCRRDAVEFIVNRGPAVIDWLIKRGVKFTRDQGYEDDYHLTREGGHSHRRVIHAADATGKEVEDTLESQVRRHGNIQLLENYVAIDLVLSDKAGLQGERRCIGVYAHDKQRKNVVTISARKTVLATGGTCKVYLYTSNPDTSTGDGIAMAWRAGCRMANLEFIQFHPTCLYHPQAKSFLITEAVRGEGGYLTFANGQRFMPEHDERAELAPRDIVARAIDFEMKKRGTDCVYLDISHKDKAFIREHFPTIFDRVQNFGFDMSKQALPVVPAAHYTCGGVLTDLNGLTDVDGLYTVGEAAYTGLHGANRLASNSLLECLVIGESAAGNILQVLNDTKPIESGIPPWDESRVTDSDEQIVVSHNWDELRRFMWDYVGIVRTTKRLERAQHRIDLLKEEIRDYYSNFRVHNDLVELRNLVLVAELIVRSALQRKESRGLHYTRDYPELSSKLAKDTVLPA